MDYLRKAGQPYNGLKKYRHLHVKMVFAQISKIITLLKFALSSGIILAVILSS